jgi:hypothetical protein
VEAITAEAVAAPLAGVRQALQQWGLVLQSDPLAPSVTSIVARGPVRGTWWGNPAARGTYEVCEALEAQGVFCVKLLSGKLTYVHGDLVPHVIAIGRSRQPWQIERLSSGASRMLRLVEDAAEVRVDRLPPGPTKATSPAATARELEARLLVYASNLHTEAGAHTKVLYSWVSPRAGGELGQPPGAAEAQEALEALTSAINNEFTCTLTLPWQRRSAKRSR